MSELVVDKPGSYLGVRKGLFYLKSRDGSRVELPAVSLSHISIRCRGVGVSADALKLAARFGVELTVYHRGKPVAKVLHALKGGGALTRLTQIEAFKDGRGLEIAKEIVSAKLHNQRLVIYQKAKYFLARGMPAGRELQAFADRIAEAGRLVSDVSSLDSVRAYEAQGAVSYWSGVSLILPPELGFKGRTAWSPSDVFNKALNIGYGVLRGRVWSAVLSANLDPFVGFLHLPRGRHMCLVSDLMEMFRPGVVDRSLITLAVEKPSAFFDEKLFERNVVSAVVQALQHNNRFFERAIVEQARRLASFLRGEVDRYVGFRMRW
ncbi:MAG: CRISPR-associated endonuclease Cas1 [Candidatus Caldarchaeum sp.]